MHPGCTDDDAIGTDSLTESVEAPVEYQKLIKQRRKVSFGFVFGALFDSPVKNVSSSAENQIELMSSGALPNWRLVPLIERVST